MVPQIKSDKRDFDPEKFFSTMGEGRKAVVLWNKQAVFPEGDPVDAVFYIRGDKGGLAVVSKNGKQATLGVLSDAHLSCTSGNSARNPVCSN